jgi:hypothetical protein
MREIRSDGDSWLSSLFCVCMYGLRVSDERIVTFLYTYLPTYLSINQYLYKFCHYTVLQLHVILRSEYSQSRPSYTNFNKTCLQSTRPKILSPMNSLLSPQIQIQIQIQHQIQTQRRIFSSSPPAPAQHSTVITVLQRPSSRQPSPVSAYTTLYQRALRYERIYRTVQ